MATHSTGIRILVGIILVALVAGVGLVTQVPGMTAGDLQKSLRASGLDVREQPAAPDTAAEQSQPLLSGTEHVLLVNEQTVTVYEYALTAQMELDARGISADGSTITTGLGPTRHGAIIDWVAPPHWFKRGHVIVLYVGSDSLLLRDLRATLGAPFAGSADPCAGVSGPCDTVSLLAAFQARHATVAVKASKPFARAEMHIEPGTISRQVTLNGQQITVMEFSSHHAADEYAAFVKAPGHVFDAFAPLHFYEAGRLIVEAASADTQLLSLLTDVLGPPFYSQQ